MPLQDDESNKLHLRLFAYRPTVPTTGDLESRMKNLLSSSEDHENLDHPKFGQMTAADSKADYLLFNRTLVAELKALQLGTGKLRLEDRLRERFSKRDAPIVMGTVNLSRVIDSLEDSEAIYAQLNDLSSRAVRRHLKQADAQIQKIKSTFTLNASAGMLILLNDKEPMNGAEHSFDDSHRNACSRIHAAEHQVRMDRSGDA